MKEYQNWLPELFYIFFKMCARFRSFLQTILTILTSYKKCLKGLTFTWVYMEKVRCPNRLWLGDFRKLT